MAFRNTDVQTAIDLYIESVVPHLGDNPITATDIQAWCSQELGTEIVPSTVLSQLKARSKVGQLVQKIDRNVHFEYCFYVRGVNDASQE